MVRWYHLILTAYGFWLPNDPRGSWSDFVGSWELWKFGPATTTSEKRSLAHNPHDTAKRRAAKKALKFPPVRFDQVQRQCIADGFAQAIAEGNYNVLACCIGHDHAHLVVGRSERTIEQIGTHLKSRASMTLTRKGAHPLQDLSLELMLPSPWSSGVWSVFVSDLKHLKASIRYVERHPEKEGLLPQNWRFITKSL